MIGKLVTVRLPYSCRLLELIMRTTVSIEVVDRHLRLSREMSRESLL